MPLFSLIFLSFWLALFQSMAPPLEETATPIDELAGPRRERERQRRAARPL